MAFAKKRYGQNFLIDKNILKKIVTSAKISPQEHVIEIGTGRGALTREIDKFAHSVISYEIDKDVYSENKIRLVPELRNTTLIEGDFMLLPFPIPEEDIKFKVIANIPYYITTPIIEKLIDHKDKVSDIYLMVQKEVADRLVASPGNKTYGSFTIFADYHFEVKKLFNVSRNCFRPVPNVESAFIQLTPRSLPKVKVADETLFFDLVHASFWGRRKTILTAVKNYQKTSKLAEIFKRALEAYDISPTIRGERLSVKEFGMLANYISQNQ
ncbi:MAG TPA: ribosomal RNA small subunit methyltransferase A [Candidatus Margulisbacteria bacterium]|nr:ribosomal RNA small subunit methyltransferase A [Candidatus Margulisiibacteriota bacterium]